MTHNSNFSTIILIEISFAKTFHIFEYPLINPFAYFIIYNYANITLFYISFLLIL